MKNKKSIFSALGLIIGVVILLNILVNNFYFRIDFTQDNRYTLSKATKDILENLEEPVTVTAYFTEDVPPNIAQIKNDFKDLLVEFSNVSNGMLVYEFVNPNEDEETERGAMEAGVSPVLVDMREKDQVKQQKVYLGAHIQMGDETETIPFIQMGASMEYMLSSSIKKLSITDKPVIGFLQGHGEPSISALQEVYNSLSVLYRLEPVTLTDSTNALSKFNTIAIVAPKDSFPSSHLAQLDDFLASGKRMFIAMNRVQGDFSNPPRGNSVTTGLEGWLAGKGLIVENNFIIDSQCSSVRVQQQQGMFTFNSNVEFPYLPVFSTFEEHPITKGLEAVIFQFASSITYTGDSLLKFMPIVKTSEKSGTQPAPVYFDISKQWTEIDFPLSNITAGAVVEGKFNGSTMPTKMVLFADGDFPVNGEGQGAQQIQPDNASLMVNAIDWLSDDTGLIELRTKGISMRPLDEIEDGKKTLLKYTNFILPILIIILYGIIRMQMNRNLRMKRMEGNYV